MLTAIKEKLKRKTGLLPPENGRMDPCRTSLMNLMKQKEMDLSPLISNINGVPLK